jgi:hypothetical protein
MTMSQMEVENPSEHNQDDSGTSSPNLKPAWTNDTTASALSDEIFQLLQKHQQIVQDAGELEENTPTYEKPDLVIKSAPKLSQCVCFNLICHRGAVCDITTFKLFKSFAATLRNADSTLVILPYQAAKQYYSSLTNIKQIQAIDDQCLLQFFRPYYQKQ